MDDKLRSNIVWIHDISLEERLFEDIRLFSISIKVGHLYSQIWKAKMYIMQEMD